MKKTIRIHREHIGELEKAWDEMKLEIIQGLPDYINGTVTIIIERIDEPSYTGEM